MLRLLRRSNALFAIVAAMQLFSFSCIAFYFALSLFGFLLPFLTRTCEHFAQTCCCADQRVINNNGKLHTYIQP